MLLGVAAVLLLPLISRRPQRVATVLATGLLALAIGWSRIYLGYHWMTDVIASWLLATALLVAVHLASRLALSRTDGARPPRGPRADLTGTS